MSEPKAWIDNFMEKDKAFHEATGRCITAWATADDELFRIFRKAVGPYKISAIIYYRTPGLDVRMSMTYEVVSSTLLGPFPKKNGGKKHAHAIAWDTLNTDFKKLLGTRRRIAHLPVNILLASDVDPTTEGIPDNAVARLEFVESVHEQKRGRPPKALTLDDLHRHLWDVSEIAARLQSFRLTMQPERPQ